MNPDAVIRGSRIWGGTWKQERAASNRIEDAEIEDFYRKRSLLKRSVFPEDIAEAVFFFAVDLSAKSTGNILNVDAGNLAGLHPLRGGAMAFTITATTFAAREEPRLAWLQRGLRAPLAAARAPRRRHRAR